MVPVLLVFSLAACSKSYVPNGQLSPEPDTTQQSSKSSTAPETTSGTDSGSEDTQIGSEETIPTGETTNITLTIGDTVLNAQLNNTTAAKDLISRLPVTVSLNDSDNDFCGGISPALSYEESEVQYGYKNGDLAFWAAGDDFVIFVDDEELSSNTGNLVILGKIADELTAFDDINGTIDVTIALAE
nr:cyclophilin-like fold protein [uncultured Clostridium sp.]